MLAGRRRPNVSAPGLRFSFFTHYVGDGRAVNAGFLDSVRSFLFLIFPQAGTRRVFEVNRTRLLAMAL